MRRSMRTRGRAAFDQVFARWCGQSICAVLGASSTAAAGDDLDDAFRAWDAFVEGGGGDARDVDLDELSTLELLAPRDGSAGQGG
jgi:hypothetical protein